MSDILRPTSLDGLRDITEDESTNYLILYTAPSWCQPCRQFAPHFERAAEQVDNVVFVYASLDEVPAFADVYGIQSVPTTRLYARSGEVHDVHSRTVVQLIEELKSLTSN